MSYTPYDPVLTDKMQLAANDIALIADPAERVAWIVFLLQELDGELGSGQMNDLLGALQAQVTQRLEAGSWPTPATA